MELKGNSLKIFLLFLYLGMVSAGKTLNISSDYLWFKQLGFQQIFWLTLFGKVLIFALFGLSFFLIIFLNLQYVRPGGNEVLEWKFYSSKTKTAKSIPLRPQTFDGFVLFVSLVTGIIMGLVITPHWKNALKFLFASKAGVLDPVFGKDISFYLLKLPFYHAVFYWLLAAWLLIFVSVTVLYYKDYSLIRNNEALLRKSNIHMAALIGTLFLILAGFTGIHLYDFLFKVKGEISGVDYLDIKARIPALRISLILLLLGAVFSFYAGTKRNFKLPGVWVGIILLQYLGMFIIYPKVLNARYVSANPLKYKTPFIANDIKATLYAYGLDKVKRKTVTNAPFKPPTDLDGPELRDIQLWTRKIILSNFNELQQIRHFYNFSTVSIDRYKIDGQLTKVALSPRELVTARLNGQTRTWSNLHLKYTHGYGVVVSPLNAADTDGLPRFIIRDIPLTAPRNLAIDRPEIYYGLQTNGYCLVNTKVPEYNYPQGDHNIYSRYQGSGGIRMKSFLNRLIYAWKFNDWRIAGSAHLTPDSRLMFTRNIIDRVTAVTPFLHCDLSPDLVLAEGRLYWVANLYTASGWYPYSRFTEKKVNYIRNSAVATIDAYNGNIDYYIRDGADPLINTWSRIYPALFKPVGSLPEDIKKHLKYPRSLFETQIEIYRRYHVTDPKSFYEKQDIWETPVVVGSQSPQKLVPFYRIARKQGGSEEGFFLNLPLKLSPKNSFNSWVRAGCDSDNYGNITWENFPADHRPSNIQKVEKELIHNKTIRNDLAEWDHRGASLVPGNWEIIPYQGEFLYIKPMYLMASNSELSKLKRVMIAYKDKTAIGNDLSQALAAVPLKGASSEEFPGDNLQKYRKMSGQAWDHLKKSRKALMKTDWISFGREMKLLERILKTMVEGNN
ncbi:MAG: UPF0182 family protein [bacterium]